MWDQRYNSKDYAYGTEPNDFLVSMLERLPVGRVLCLAEGEGRNAVWLARQGFEVTAVDGSSVGLQKAQRLAEACGVAIDTVHSDLADYEIVPEHWDVIVSIFCHLQPELRRTVHKSCVSGLRSGGIMLLEAYTPDQLAFNTGGPPNAELMMDKETLTAEFNGLEFLHLQECTREIHEGQLHNGLGAVVQLLGRKSQEPAR